MSKSNRLKELRKEKGLTLSDVQKDTGINRATYNNYENGKTEPRLETWNKLAEYYQVPVTYLQGISSERDAVKNAIDVFSKLGPYSTNYNLSEADKLLHQIDGLKKYIKQRNSKKAAQIRADQKDSGKDKSGSRVILPDSKSEDHPKKDGPTNKDDALFSKDLMLLIKNAETFNGKPISKQDRKTVLAMLSGYFNSKDD